METPTTSLRAAIIQVTGNTEDTRLRRKFNSAREQLLTAAKLRQLQRTQQAADRSRVQVPWSMSDALSAVTMDQVAALKRLGTHLASTERALVLMKEIENLKKMAPTLKHMGMQFAGVAKMQLEMLNNPLLQQAVQEELSIFSRFGGMVRHAIEDEQRRYRP